MSVFVDTSAIIAYISRDDAQHLTATRLMQTLAQRQAPLISTSYVIVEAIALMQRRLGLAAVRDYQESMAPLLDIVWIDQSLHAAGLAAMLAANRRQLSLVDCVSFEVCRRRRIEQVFAFDRHFAEQGFAMLR
jgi:predicted nucleic acid-binding protein